MNLPDAQEFYQSLRTRLEQKGYVETGAVHPIDLAFLKASAFGNRVIGVIDTSQRTGSVADMFEKTQKWFQQMHGTAGAGCLLFVYHGEPSSDTVAEIQKIGGYMTAGAHDLHSGKHWLANHLNWEQDIYGK